MFTTIKGLILPSRTVRIPFFFLIVKESITHRYLKMCIATEEQEISVIALYDNKTECQFSNRKNETF